ncbi:MAG: NADH-quinone oxidoreductase subunit C [Actinomycetota bacterium]
MSDSYVPAPGFGLFEAALSFDELEQRVTGRFEEVTVERAHSELTFHAQPHHLVELLTFCRDELRCETLADLSGVHWPAGDHVVERQTSTTGWPAYRTSRERGVIEVLYIVRSMSRNQRFRVSVGVDDESPQLPSVTGVYPTAEFHEREVYDFFGVEFADHPNLTRILMPDDWIGHPHRKDYPLGGVDIDYKHDKFIPPPHERDLREVVD